MTKLNDIVAISAVRTPMGRFGGTLKDMAAYHLGAVALDLQGDVGDAVTPGGGTQRGPVLGLRDLVGARHPRDEVMNDLAALDLSHADVEDSVLGERRDVGLHVAEVQGKHVARLEVLDLRPILSVEIEVISSPSGVKTPSTSVKNTRRSEESALAIWAATRSALIL